MHPRKPMFSRKNLFNQPNSKMVIEDEKVIEGRLHTYERYENKDRISAKLFNKQLKEIVEKSKGVKKMIEQCVDTNEMAVLKKMDADLSKEYNRVSLKRSVIFRPNTMYEDENDEN